MGFLQLRPGDIERLCPALVRHMRTVRAHPGCLDYVIGSDIELTTRLRVVERWVDAQAQAAHLIGDHMAAFNIAMQSAKASEAQLDTFEGPTVRRILELPPKSFRPAYEDADGVVVFAKLRLRSRMIDGIVPRLCAHAAHARASRGCRVYAVARDCGDPCVFTISERWTDAAARSEFVDTPESRALDIELARASAGDGALQRGWRTVSDTTKTLRARLRERRTV